MRILKKSFWLLWLGLLGILISFVGAFTPVHWHVERYLWGVQDQYYPELFYLFVVLPISFVLSFIGFFVAVAAPETAKPPD